MRDRVMRLGVSTSRLVVFLVSVSCGGPSARDHAVGSVAPSTSTSASVGSNEPVPNTKGAITGEDRGAACLIGTFPATATNPLLPDPFQRFDGTRVSTQAQWQCRREELLKLAEKHAFGTKPSPPESVTGTVSPEQISVTISDGGKTSSFTASIKLPASGQAPYPAVVAYGGASGVPLDAAVLDNEGVAIINCDAYAVGAENNGRGSSQEGAFYQLYSGGSERGLLVAWAWGVSRILDVIAASDGSVLAADAIGVAGCSRFGKGAFVAGVLDERIALTMPIESGTFGVPLWRGIALNEQAGNGNGPQTLKSAYDEQPWFGDDFRTLTNAPEMAPLDSHTLIGMIAPRGLFIMDNPHIGELAPKSGHAAALAGAEVYRALGVYDAVSYSSDVNSGTHCSRRSEWSAPLEDNVRRFLTKTGNNPGVIKAAASQTSSLETWKDWETPALL